jgi:pterin-4a-carbinolamine dehydratase
MSGKQMEGDNQRRRALARQAREAGQAPSEAGVTLGASKQPEHAERSHRVGPPPAGAHKPLPSRRSEPTPVRPGRPWPRWDPTAFGVSPDEFMGLIQYREFVTAVAEHANLDFDSARAAAEATFTALARTLSWPARQLLLRTLPAELHDDFAINVPYYPRSLAGFVNQISRILHRPPDQARYQAHVVISTFAQQAADLVAALGLPEYLGEMTSPPPTGGGVVGPTGHTPPLTDDELRDALAHLPMWAGNQRALMRTIELPPGNLDRVLSRLDRLRTEFGRGPHIGRENDTTATLVVRTRRADAVTALDVDLAHRVDAAILEAGAGMS